MKRDELTGISERDERDLERGVLRGGEVPGGEGAVESRARMTLGGHVNAGPGSIRGATGACASRRGESSSA